MNKNIAKDKPLKIVEEMHCFVLSSTIKQQFFLKLIPQFFSVTNQKLHMLHNTAFTLTKVLSSFRFAHLFKMLSRLQI